ncbi:MAG: hypothetical protein ABI456_19835 [Ktedonobacteraceae bacterium]
MTQSSIPGAIPIDVEQLALKKELGRFQDVYSATLGAIGMMAFSLLMFVGLLYVTFNILLDPTQGWPGKLFQLIFIILGLLAFGCTAYWSYCGHTDEVFLYENGWILKYSSRLEALHWNEVQCTESHAFYSSNCSGVTYTLCLKNGRALDVSGALFRYAQERVGR